MTSPAESMLIDERIRNRKLEEYITDLEQLIIGLHDDDDNYKRRIDLRKLKYTIYAHKNASK
jgi:hypothetical protein